MKKIFLTVCVSIILAASATAQENSIKIKEPQMVMIPAGSFEMGQIMKSGMRLGFPVHKVTLTHPFMMGKYEITNAEYVEMLNYALAKKHIVGDFTKSVQNATGKKVDLIFLDKSFKGIETQILFDGAKFIVKEGLEQRPVFYITWFGAAFYCNMLSESQGLKPLYDLNTWEATLYPSGLSGYRLPTEAEWEYVARYGDGRLFPWGNEFNVKERSNFGMIVGSTSDVGSFEAGKSELGLYDMCGNVEEWVNDWYGTYKKDDSVNPPGIPDGVYKEKRGGSWYNDDNNMPFAAYRYDTNYRYTYYFDIGFRILKI